METLWVAVESEFFDAWASNVSPGISQRFTATAMGTTVKLAAEAHFCPTSKCLLEQQGIPGFRAEWVESMDAGQMETLWVAVESEFFTLLFYRTQPRDIPALHRHRDGDHSQTCRRSPLLPRDPGRERLLRNREPRNLD
jgi:hypothetical protein